MHNGNNGSQHTSQNASKKRTFGQFNQQQAQDQKLLFGENENQGFAEAGNERYDDAHPQFRRDDEASEGDDPVELDSKSNSEDNIEGEDLDENLEDDYKPNEQLDRYDNVGIDDADHQLRYEDRVAAERAMNQRDRQQQRGNLRMADAFADDEGEFSENDGVRRQMRLAQMNEEIQDDGNQYANVNDYSEATGKISEWIQKTEVTRFIKRQFNHFIRSHRDERTHVPTYQNRIEEMCQNNKQSFQIDFRDLSNKVPTLAIWLAEEPALVIPMFNVVAGELVAEMYPDYHNTHSNIFVRVDCLPVEDKLRELRQVHLNALVKFRGVVTKRTGVFPEYSEMYFACDKCKDVKGPFYGNNAFEVKMTLGKCVVCGEYRCSIEETRTVYRNYQKMTIQETPGSVPPGRVPRQKEVIVLHDLVDMARPGDEVEITGIYTNKYDYTANVKHGFPVFQTVVEANNLKRFGDEEIIELTDEDKAEIRKLGHSKGIENKIINSIAPSIYGHEFVKKTLALAMFGGESKDVGGKHRIRGDINVLLLGDPGTAKSQFLKYVEQVFHRVVYTTGKGASAVGLTAGVHKDPISGEWVLEGGALVLADKGICLIDEFDKMNDQDRTSIHEAMEQQSISISKAGIVTSLQARCSVIAAANPIGGVYRPSLNFNDNVDLTDPILSRFDILTVIRDEADDVIDDRLATFVINSHMKNHPTVRDAPNRENDERVKIQQNLTQALLDDSHIPQTNPDLQISQEMLKKYMMYARRFVKPKLNEIDIEKVTNFYKDIRKESLAVGGIPIAVRHIESVLRMSEAHAKMHLRDYVRSDDIDFAIEMMLESFLQSQKISVARTLSSKLEKYKSRRTDVNQLLYHTLMKTATQRAIFQKFTKGIEETGRIHVEIPKHVFMDDARDFNQHNIEQFFHSGLFNKDFRLDGDTIKTVREI